MADSRIDDLRRRLERDPGSRLFAQLAEEHRKAGEFTEAIRVARAGLAVHPAYPSARLTLGRALLESGDPAAARAELEAALHDAPDNILASRLLGQVLEALGEVGEALAQLEKTLRMAPGDRQLEGQIVALRTKLGSRPGAPSAPGAAAARPASAPPPLPEEEPGELPTTILIYGGDRGRARAPLPPSAPVPSSAPPESPGPEPKAPPPPPAGETASSRAGGPAPPPRPIPAGGLSVEETVFEAEGAPEGGGEPRTSGAWAADAAAQEGTPFSSSTLAELYYRQGLVDTAAEVYRKVLADEPSNERARTRLDEITNELPSDERSVRRRQLEGMITGLEGVLAALRKKRA